MYTFGQCCLAAGVRPETAKLWVKHFIPLFSLDRPPNAGKRDHMLPAGAAVYLSLINFLTFIGMKLPAAHMIARACTGKFMVGAGHRMHLVAWWKRGGISAVELMPSSVLALRLREGGHWLMHVAIDLDQVVAEVSAALDHLRGENTWTPRRHGPRPQMSSAMGRLRP